MFLNHIAKDQFDVFAIGEFSQLVVENLKIKNMRPMVKIVLGKWVYSQESIS